MLWYAVALNAQSTEAELIQPEHDLQYLGAFRLPNETSNGTKWNGGGQGMTYYPNGDAQGPNDGFPGSLFSISHPSQNLVSEFNIPVPVISHDKNLNDLPVAETLQPFADVTAGRQTGGLTGLTLSDIQYYPRQDNQSGDKLYWVMYVFYLPKITEKGHGWSELDFSNLQSKGVWRLDDFPSSATNKYLFDIPKNWAVHYTPDKYLAAGRYRSQNDGSWGPALYAYGPWQGGNPPADGSSIPAVELLKYSEDHEIKNLSIGQDNWNDGAWLTTNNKSAVIFAGVKAFRSSAAGLDYYGFPQPDGTGDKGHHAEPYYAAMLFYDPALLARVATGELLPSQVQPYALFNLNNYLFSYYQTSDGYRIPTLGGLAFDRKNNILYVIEKNVEGYFTPGKPIVHVFKIIDQHKKPDRNRPTPPQNIHLESSTSETVSLSWQPAIDNVSVAGYFIFRDNLPIAFTPKLSYTDNNVNPDCEYSYTIIASDERDNRSNSSTPLIVKTLQGADSKIPLITDIYISDITENSAVIHWKTDELATTRVTYNIEYNSDIRVYETSALSTIHTAVLHDLPPTSYESFLYAISSTDAFGNTNEYPAKRFKTSKVGADNFAPVLNGIGAKRVYPGEPLELNIEAEDLDREILTFTVSGLPPGAIFDQEEHSFYWTPSQQDVGIHKVIFMISDGDQTDSEEVPLIVVGDSVTDVKSKTEKKTIDDFELFQNYPNPFNPTTSIKYALKETEKVELNVYNLLGQKVSSLVNKIQAPGVYTIEFNAEGLSSGIYWYILRNGKISISRKLILLK